MLLRGVGEAGEKSMLDSHFESEPEANRRLRRAYLVDDDEAFRKSLELLLSSHGWEVEAFDSPKAFVMRSAELEPGLLLLDLNLPGTSGLELLESGIPELDRFAIIMVTGAGEIRTAVRTIRAGAIDFIEKPFSAPDLLGRLDALDATLAGTLRDKAAAMEARRLVDSLSPRERDVLERLLSGGSNKVIGRALGLSPRTVEMHRAKMLDRLGATTTAEALEIARRAGLEPVALG
jgi:two-component system response regulator FixJ